MTEFLAAIFEGTQEPKFFQTLANDAGDADEAPNKKPILTDQVASIARFVAKYDRNRRGLFFCVSTIAKGSSTRNKDNCREITVAHTDLDFRSIAEDEPTVRRLADTFPVPPSIVVNSGGGLHLYWLLKEPLPAQEYRERIEALNRKLASVLAGDLQATDVCRLMRLPGTTNSKHGDQRVVSVRVEGAHPREMAERWAQVLGPDAVLAEGGERIAMTQGSISFVPQGGRGEGLAGWTWDVADLASVQRVARDQGIAVGSDRIALFGAEVTLAER